MNRTIRLCLLTALLGVAAAVTGGCAQSSTADDEPRRLFTLFDIQEALHAGRTIPAGPAFGSGIAPDSILTPGPSGDSLKITAAFSEGGPAAYVTTDLWTNFPEVWVQPWYVLVSAWNEKSPRDNKLADGTTPALIDVGPKSAFYSPFWLILYAVVDPRATADTYSSSRQLIDDGAPLHPGAPWFYTMRPLSIVLTPAKPLHPILGVEVGNVTLSPGARFEGEILPYVNVGANNFRYDDKMVVEEVPLFIFARRESSGAPARIGAPDVVGSSPLFSRRPAEVVGAQPRFGAFTRFYLAYLPEAAAAFDPAANPGAVMRLGALATPVDPKIYQGRVATNKDCFGADTFPASCTWLDSQQRVEDALGHAGIERTQVTAATPLVFYAGKAIPR